ncbi:hypothetical protein JTB14_006397 [Gonioctena quinquepunctata]|nr:hypothetical protein JTB14_006397 [Gonioctena quinquepunctata]
MVLMARNLEIQSDSGDTQAVYDGKEKLELTELTNVNYEYDITEGYHINMPETHQFLDKKKLKKKMMPRINVLQDIVIPVEQNIDINTEINDGHTLRESQSVNEVETVTEVPNQSQLLTKKGYPRKRKTNTIKKCERKKLKLQEKRKAYALKKCTSCTNKCIRKCKDKITENRRQQINDEFWKMSWSEQRIFIVGQCQRQIPKKHTENSSRANTYFYYLKNEEGTSAQVCKPFFLTTLGFKYNNDTVLQNALKNSQNHLLSTKRDMRGRKPSTSKLDHKKIRIHIESFNPSISHYRREHAPDRRYSPENINIKFMWNDYNNKNKNDQCSYDVYRNVLENMNISFTKLGHEQCETCGIFSFHEHSKDIQPNCEKCEEQTGHLEKVKKARAAYQKDKFQKDKKMMCYSVDLQKNCGFQRKLCACRRKKHLNAVAAIWHEGIAGRKKEDIISSFHAFFLKNRDAQTVTLWLDNCSAQNKNWCMFSFLTYIVNSSEIATNEIHLKYFQAGHTFMSADSFHHQVELSMKKSGNIYDFNDFHEAVQRANSGKVDVISMTPSHFSDWKDFSSQYKLKKTKPRAYLNNMVMASFTRGEHTFVYYNDFDGVDHKLSFLQAQIEKRGITKPLIEIDLGEFCNPKTTLFWKNSVH